MTLGEHPLLEEAVSQCTFDGDRGFLDNNRVIKKKQYFLFLHY